MVRPDYRIDISGRVARPMSLTLDQLPALPSHDTVLPIACVEGWSYSAPWSGVRIRDLLAMARAEPDRTVLLQSLEPQGAYHTSTLTSARPPTVTPFWPPTSTANPSSSTTGSPAA